MSDMRGNFIIETKRGGLFAADKLQPSGDWIMAETEGLPISFMVEDLAAIYEVGRGIASVAEINHANHIAASILRLEKLIHEFQETHQAYAKNLEIVICGAVSLALTVLPDRTTKDIDLVAKGTFIEFLKTKNRNDTNLEIEVLNPSFLFYLGFWRERAARLTGYQGTQFLVLHPLDTIAQKLQRLQADRFEAKDQPDIDAIISTFHPTSKALVDILTENPSRFRMASEEEEKAMTRNTHWFLKKFLPSYTFQQIKRLALERRSDELRSAGMAPLDNINLHTKLPLKKIGVPDDKS
ncbi:MAG: hypothetical protein KF897_03460 [Opitutaceae bacterium]|nr:hypothetical protein [Opitutaceae bacterium]